MGTEAVVIPIIVDPKAGVAGLVQIGKQAEETGRKFTGVSSAAGSFGDKMKSLAGGILGFSGITSAATIIIKELADKLLNAGSAFSKAEIDAAKFTNEIHNAKEGIQQFVDYLSFEADLNKLMAQLKLGKGFAADQKLIGIEMENNNAIIQNSQQQIEKYNKSISNLRTNAPWLVGKDAQTLLTQFPSFGELPDNLINKLSTNDKELLKEVKANALLVQSEYERIRKVSMDNQRLTIQLQINSNEEAAKLEKKRLEDYEKYVTEMIALGKQYASYFKNVIVVPDFNILDSKQNLFEKAKQFVNDIKGGNVKFKIPIFELDITPPSFTGSGASLEDVFPEMKKYFNSRNPTDFSLINKLQHLDEEKKKAEELLRVYELQADLISNTLSPAFESMFDAILNKEDALKAFFNAIAQSIKQLIAQLISAAIRAAALSLITGGAAKGGLSFASAFKKIIGFADGGLVTGPVSALVGEGSGTSRSNPEVVAPLDRLQSFFRSMMQGGQGSGFGNMGTAQALISVPDKVQIYGNGRDFYGTMELTRQKAGRTG